MCNHCGCGSGWSQPVIPAPLEGITSFKAPFAGAVARSFAQKLGDVLSAADFGFTPSNTAAGNLAAWGFFMGALAIKGGRGIIPAGTYHVSNALVMNALSGVHIDGESPSDLPNVPGVVIICDNPAEDGIQMLNCSHSSISGLKIGYMSPASSGTYALRLINTYNCKVFDLGTWSNTVRNGILVECTTTATGPTFSTRIERCTVNDALLNGIELKGFSATKYVSECWITACVAINCGGTGISIGDFCQGIFINGATDLFGNQRGIVVSAANIANQTGNVIISSGVVTDTSDLENILIVKATRVIVEGAWISVTGGGADGVLISESIDCVVKNCEVYLSAGNGVQVQGGSGHAIQSCHFYANTTRAIHLDGNSANCDVLGNTSSGAGQEITNGGTGNAIGPNLFSGGFIAFGDLIYSAALLAGNPILNFDANDFLKYDRVANQLQVFIADAIQQFLIGGGGAGESSIMIRDITAGAGKRVSFGADNSGGAGFKVLRVPN